MKRIIIVMATVLLILGTVFAGCAGPAKETPTTPTTPTTSVKPIQWRYATFVPGTAEATVFGTAWARELEKESGGRLRINIYYAESLVKMAHEYDAVAGGTSDIGTPSMTMFRERFPMNQFINSLWILQRPLQTAHTFVDLFNKYKELRDELGGPVKLMWFNPITGEQIQSTKPVQTMEDLKGLKIGSTSAEVIKAYQLFGAAPVNISVTERYQAMQTGILDASTENWAAVRIWRLHEVAKYRVDGLNMKPRGYPTVVNIESYNSLPEDIKRIFDELTDPSERTIETASNHEANDRLDKEIIQEYDKKVGNPPWYVILEAERERWKELTKPINEQLVEFWEKKGLPGRAFYEDMIAFAEKYKALPPVTTPPTIK